jgi:hypothetical protein
MWFNNDNETKTPHHERKVKQMVQTVQQFIDSYKGKSKAEREKAFAKAHVFDDVIVYGCTIKDLKDRGCDDDEISDALYDLERSFDTCSVDEAEEIFNKWESDAYDYMDGDDYDDEDDEDDEDDDVFEEERYRHVPKTRIR